MKYQLIAVLFIATMAQHSALEEQTNKVDRIKFLLDEIRRLRSVKSRRTVSKSWPDYLFQDLDSVARTANERRSQDRYVQQGCSKRSVHSLFKRIGSYDPSYMATSLEEAALFPDLKWESRKRSKYMYILKRLGRSVIDYANNDLGKIMSFRVLLEKKLGLPHYNVFKNHYITNTTKLKRSSGGSNCDREKISAQSIPLCVSCSTSTQLTNEYYPRFINQVFCDDTKCLRGNGVCHDTITNVKILKRTNTDPCTYAHVTVPVSTGCRCQVSQGSKFADCGQNG